MRMGRALLLCRGDTQAWAQAQKQTSEARIDGHVRTDMHTQPSMLSTCVCARSVLLSIECTSKVPGT